MVGSVVGLNKSGQKETTLFEPRQVEASSGGQEGCNDRVRMVRRQNLMMKIGVHREG